uniref:Uncharacterized protein n=1 Tax=Tanacetum cinerariifolium TaxID=118510 RepID=A0A6L2JMY0_TANCI|nr:hypothetical protein [Tanacetum cinerariifolium]
MLAPTFGHNRARSTPIQDLGVIYVLEWYDLVDNKRYSIYESDAMLEDLGIKGGSFLFSHFRIPGKSLDEGLVPLISHQDVLSLLKYVPSYKEIDVYVEKHTMEVVFDKGEGVVIEEIIEDDEVIEASETGYRGQSLLLNENDVQTGNMDLTSKVDHPLWSSGSLSDSDISEHPPWSSESMNEKRNKRWNKEFQFRIQLFKNDFAFGLDLSQDPIDMAKVVKAELEMQEPLYYNFHPLVYDNDYDRSISGLVGDLETWNNDDDLLQQVDPYDWQEDPNHGDDEAEENERIEQVVDEEIERPRKKKRENEDESASANELQDDELEKSREMMLQSCYL